MLPVKCLICQHETQAAFQAKVLEKYQVQYFHCKNCGFIQTETPYWLEEAYQSALNLTDTGLVIRNETNRARTTAIIYQFLNHQGKFLDYAGGYGLFTRMMRDVGYDFYWEDAYAQNMIARGFDHKEGDKYEAITAFEVFEHLENPKSELKKMLERTSTIICSTQLLPVSVPPTDWWYYGFHHGQHVALYSRKSLEILAQENDLNLYTNGGDFHLLTDKKISATLFRIACKLSTRGLYKLIRRQKKSLTMDDHLRFYQH